MKLLLLICLLLPLQIFAQDELAETDRVYNFSDSLDVKPEFRGGVKKFYKYLAAKLRTPEDEWGKMIVRFIIERDGTLSHITVEPKNYPRLSSEIRRILLTCPKWIPGQYKNETVRVNYIFPLTISQAVINNRR